MLRGSSQTAEKLSAFDDKAACVSPLRSLQGPHRERSRRTLSLTRSQGTRKMERIRSIAGSLRSESFVEFCWLGSGYLTLLQEGSKRLPKDWKIKIIVVFLVDVLETLSSFSFLLRQSLTM